MGIDKQELIRRVALRTCHDETVVATIVDATWEEIYDNLKQGESITLRDFGTFYVRSERSQWVFKFNPSQRLRKAFGWSSTYKGEA